MSAGDAVTLTNEIKATVQEAVTKYGSDRVAPAILAAAKRLQATAKPLAQRTPMPFTDRREVDNAADRLIAGIYNICDSIVQAYELTLVPLTPEQRHRLNQARAVQESVFAEGITFLKARWSDQYGTTEMLLQRARETENQDRIKALGLTPEFALLEKVHQIYGERMGFTRVRVDDKEQDPLVEWHEAMEAYLGGIILYHKKNSEIRQYLTSPYERVVEKMRARRTAATPSQPTQATATDTSMITD